MVKTSMGKKTRSWEPSPSRLHYDLRYISFIDVPSMSWDVVPGQIQPGPRRPDREVRRTSRAEVKGFCKFPILHLKIFEVIYFQTNLSILSFWKICEWHENTSRVFYAVGCCVARNFHGEHVNRPRRLWQSDQPLLSCQSMQWTGTERPDSGNHKTEKQLKCNLCLWWWDMIGFCCLCCLCCLCSWKSLRSTLARQVADHYKQPVNPPFGNATKNNGRTANASSSHIFAPRAAC